MDPLSSMNGLSHKYRVSLPLKGSKALCSSKSIRLISLLFAGVLFGSGAAAATAESTTEIGGAGTLSLRVVTCFKSESKIVPIICGEPTVHYKLTTLMGDPLGNYGVSWKVFSFHIANNDGKGTEYYSSGDRLPTEIWNARENVELSLYGAAQVMPMEWPFAVLQFNTGAGVKANGEVSLNVPDGYNWEKFLRTHAHYGGREAFNLCSDTTPWIDATHAKKLMRSGFQLYDLHICPRTSVNVDSLERVISKWCEARAENRPKYCPPQDKEEEARQKKPTTDPFAALDRPAAKAVAASASKDPFAVLDGGKLSGAKVAPFDLDAALDKAEAVRVAAVERKRLYEETRASCEQDMARQEVCSKDTCGTEPPMQVCVREVRVPGHCPPSKTSGSCIVFDTYTCEERGPNPAHTKWRACLRDAATQCAALGKKITSVSSCVSERMASIK